MLLLAAQTVHKFRSKRGVAHVSPNYAANHMDARYMIESVRWLMNELVRLFWSGNRDEAAKVVRELLQFEVPAIGKFSDVIVVQRTDLSAEEELLILLHFAGEPGFSRKELGIHAKCSAPAVTRAIQSLGSNDRRQIIQIFGGNYVLTDLGQKRVREELADKLLLE
jgi:hypothetical protein